MLVVRCRNPNSAERELIEALRALDGIAFIGYTVAQGEREREIDALVFTPVRAVAIEVKAPMLATPREGELIPFINAPWTIGGERAEFYGGSNPNGQAKMGAQIFATYLRENIDKTPFIQVAVAISDADLVMSKGPVMVGQTAVALSSQAQAGLELMKKKAIPLEMTLEIIEAMDLGVMKPSLKEIEKEWANAEELQKNTYKVDDREALRKKKKKKEEVTKNAFFEFMEKFSDAFTAATVVFLFVWFLYTLGVLDGISEFFDALQSFVSSLTGSGGHSSGP